MATRLVSAASRSSLSAVRAAPLPQRFYAKGKGKGKNSKAVEEDEVVDEASGEVPVMHTKGKKGKGKAFAQDEAIGDTSLPGEQFDLSKLESNMKHSIDRLRVNLNKLVAQVGRVRPDLLDDVKVRFEGDSRPLREFANVTVKDGKELFVTVYDESYTKAVTSAIQTSALALNPQASGATTLRIPIPKPDWKKRQQLVREASNLCENARVSIRAARHQGQKEIKHDVDNKVIGTQEGRSETKKLDAATKTHSDEVDSILAQAEKVLMDES